jgi:hypothetical protein
MRLKNWRFYIKRVEVFKTSTLFYFILILWFQRRRCLKQNLSNLLSLFSLIL